MLTINGQKMGKSYNNFITLEQFFTGNHPLLEKAYSPMTIRFFVLSAHYRGTVDFSNEALQAAEKGYEKLMNAIADIDRIQPTAHEPNESHEAHKFYGPYGFTKDHYCPHWRHPTRQRGAPSD
jgi:cysteinyl-tRNA synthetase